jgi:hypothetical protein
VLYLKGCRIDTLYKYCQIKNPEEFEKEYSVINLLKNQITFSIRSNFNDLFDSKIDLIKPTKAEIKSTHSMLKGKYKKNFKQKYFGEHGKKYFDDLHHKINKKFDEYLFLCLTEKPDCNLMWSHYASSHKGFCLEWDTSDIDAKKVKYQYDIASFELLDLIKIEYGLCDEGEIGKKIWSAFNVKLKEWEYENEFRIQLGGGMEHLVSAKNSKFAIVSYKPCWIKSIIFGCRMEPKAIAYLDERLPSFIKRKYAVERKSKIMIESKR